MSSPRFLIPSSIVALLAGIFACGSADGDGAAPAATDTSTPDGGVTRDEDTDAGSDARASGDAAPPSTAACPP